ncbi:transcription factor IIA, alpha/beta subunit [Infundibulicybe gibba]|nr:transcription factor IIA, alpha/beta subunit [Infundibulicybe gibba]
MSNKIVPGIYRAVIDDVIAAIKPEFDEYGVAEDVLAELQHKWENKVIASHVAEFDPTSHHQPQVPQHHAYPPHPMHMIQHPYPGNPYAPMPPGPTVKTEPVESRYMLAPGGYALPPLPGPPMMNGTRPPQPPQHPGGQTSVISFSRHPAPAQPASQPQAASAAARPFAPPTAATGQPQQPRIPQVDGPSSSSGDEDSPSPPPTFAPRASHPSLPQPTAATQNDSQRDEEAINSDLDDSDTEGEDGDEEGAAGETDIVFCTYDKVARVKNKWKCILKDGMIHVNGRDYLFAKCTGEFEW